MSGGTQKKDGLNQGDHTFWKDFTLQDALYLGFCATFIIITRAVLRLHLKIPGHSMFFMMFFLMLARASVPKKGAATVTGLIAGLMGTLMGMGKGGPLIILKFVVPAFAVDIAVALYPLVPTSYIACIVAGAIASSTRSLPNMLIDWLMGMEKTVMFQRVLIESALGMVFGGLGSAMVPPIVRRLKAHGLIS